MAIQVHLIIFPLLSLGHVALHAPLAAFYYTSLGFNEIYWQARGSGCGVYIQCKIY